MNTIRAALFSLLLSVPAMAQMGASTITGAASIGTKYHGTIVSAWASAPSTSVGGKGAIYYNTANGNYYKSSGTGWVLLLGSGSFHMYGDTLFVDLDEDTYISGAVDDELKVTIGNSVLGTWTPTGLTTTGTLAAGATTVTGATLRVIDTNTITVTPNSLTAGELPAGTLISSTDNMIILPNDTAGKKFVLGYRYNGASWASALEIASEASGYGDLILMKTGGNVGIGDTTPDEALDVVGTIAITPATATEARKVFTTPSSGATADTLRVWEGAITTLANASVTTLVGSMDTTRTYRVTVTAHIAGFQAESATLALHFGNTAKFSALGGGAIEVKTTECTGGSATSGGVAICHPTAASGGSVQIDNNTGYALTSILWEIKGG